MHRGRNKVEWGQEEEEDEWGAQEEGEEGGEDERGQNLREYMASNVAFQVPKVC
jgi:hypothetical protein